MSWLTAQGNPCNHALLLDRCLSRPLISQVIPYDFLVYLSHSKEIKCAFRFIAESGLRAEWFYIYKVLSVNPLVATFTRGFARNHLVNRFQQHIYKAILANGLVNLPALSSVLLCWSC